ncbi:Transposon Ty3-I Gag-Pol polyprotein [Aduncisulcus paluster]|uniref:RNA-directed DNA polymerase n=1 Tax=Aduncisulcus paluster TaxID=2918883 RepID=A0ABQ5KGQ7_9EUKA|nr:Transposon Ty3-I Gag-Pol polyprotein [Aduncisulcus paluster]
MPDKTVKKLKEEEEKTTIKAPFLKELSTEAWSEFMRNFDHYASIGGHRKWPEIVDPVVLSLIKDLAKVPDFEAKSHHKKARAAVNAIFASTSDISLYDELGLIKMKKELSVDALLDYIKRFKDVRGRAKGLGTTEEIVQRFIDNLSCERLKCRILAALDTKKADLAEVVRTSVVQIKIVIENELEHKALEREKLSFSDAGKECHFCHEIGHIMRDCPNGGKRRVGSRPLRGRHDRGRGRRTPFIKNRDTRYKRFFPGVVCKKCGELGHYPSSCLGTKSSDTSKGDRKYFIKSFIQNENSSFARYGSLSSGSRSLDVSFLLDSGASTSVISLRLALELGFNNTETSDRTAELGDGSLVTTLGSMELKCMIPGYDRISIEFEELFCVLEMKNPSFEVLLGEDCILNNSLLDWQQPEKKVPEEGLEDELDDSLVGLPMLEEATMELKMEGTKEFKDALFDIIKTYESRVNRLEPACVEEYTLRLKDGTKPIAQKRRSIPQGLFLEVKDQITELKEKGFIRDSKSEFASPLVLVDKKDGGTRVCVDYRLINRYIVDDMFPIPRMDEMFAALGGMKVFTTLDLKSGYYQVAVEESVRKVLAFNTPFGLFEWNRMPFGVKTAPVDEQGRRISPEKLDNLKKVKRPQTLKEVQSFMGKMNFLREFIPHFSVLSTPISDLIKEKKPVKWKNEQEMAFKRIIKALELQLTICAPKLDGQFILRTDASKLGIGGVLLQKEGEKESLISLFSRKFSKREQNWSTIEQECFGIVFGIQKNRHILVGSFFTVETDHRNLQFLFKSEVPKLVRWRMQISHYAFSIKHIKGSENGLADFLSRIEISQRDMIPQMKKKSVPSVENKVILLSGEKEIKKKNEVSEAQNVPTKDIEDKWETLRITHKTLGHAGPSLVTRALKNRNISWKGMKNDAEEVVKKCLYCQKLKKGKDPMVFGTIKESELFKTISIDTVGPLEPDKNGYKYLMVAICNFSRFVFIIALRTMSKEETARALLTRILATHGVPHCIRSDGGGQFKNELSAELCKMLGVSRIITKPYNHEENGIVERVNREIRKLIRIESMQEDTQDYEMFAALAASALNARVHSATGFAPHTLLFGCRKRLSLDLSEKPEIQNSIEHEFISDFVKRHQRITATAKEKQEEEIMKEKEKVVDKKFKVGEKVFVRPAKDIRRKSQPALDGPFTIIEKLSDYLYKIEPLIGGQAREIPVRRLREYVEGTETPEEIKAVVGRDEEELGGRGDKISDFEKKEFWCGSSKLGPAGLEPRTLLSQRKEKPVEPSKAI